MRLRWEGTQLWLNGNDIGLPIQNILDVCDKGIKASLNAVPNEQDVVRLHLPKGFGLRWTEPTGWEPFYEEPE